MRVTHQRSDFHGAVSLVQVDAPGIDDHGHIVYRTDGSLEAVASHGAGLVGKAVYVVVVDVASGLDQRAQVAEARAQHDRYGMFDGRLAALDDVLGYHADPLLLQEMGKDAVSLGQLAGMASIVDDPDAA